MRKKIIKTRRGEIKTPAFLPDATYGSINTISFADAASAGVDEIVTTTLHIELKLGSEYISKMGGLHNFFGWNRPILTDSGGFQVFSLIYRKPNKYNFIDDDAAHFKDPANGSIYSLSPEKSLSIQHLLDSDIRVVLDEPLAHGADAKLNKASVERTTMWAKRSKRKFLQLLAIDEEEYAKTSVDDEYERPLLGAVIQGSDSRELRKRSAEELIEIGFDSYNFGGLALDEKGQLDLELSQYLVELLPEDKIRYAMGVGTPDNIIALAKMGWDLFDCVLPTRNARHGYLHVKKGEGDTHYKHYSVMHLRSERYANSNKPISEHTHPALKNISQAYLRHLLRISEPAGQRLATLHNLWFYSQLMKDLREGKYD
jgi:queuine tRNA-ribosyltransferase